MIALILYIFFFIVIAGVGVISAWSDVRGMTIPNWHSLAVGGAFFAAYTLLWMLGREDVYAPLGSHLMAAGGVFLITLGMFAAGGLGAGDSKLGTVYALWAGLSGVLYFLFYMALIGGVLAIAALVLKKWPLFKNPKDGSWVARVQGGESKVPYGIAIVGGALASFVKIGYFDLEVLSSFVQ